MDFPILSGNQVLISDIEMPDQFTLMLKLTLLVGMARDINNLGVIGDIVATDQAALNTWATTWLRAGKDYEAVIDEDLLANLKALGKWYKTPKITEANHDIRLAKATDGQVHLGMLLGEADVEYSRYEYLYIDTPRGMVRATHPRNFSADPITLGQHLYSVEQGPHFDYLNPFNTLQKCHQMVAHCHRQQRSMSPDGVYEIVSFGTLRHPQYTQYLNKGASKHKKWDVGFWVLEDGYFHMMALNGTDWFRELGGNDGFYKLVKDELEMLRYPKKGVV